MHERLVGRDLAYTTVMTVLDRLARKDVVVRERDGRAFRYSPRLTRAEMTAGLMHEALGVTGADRDQALVSFVGEASEDDLAALRRALDALVHADARAAVAGGPATRNPVIHVTGGTEP